MRSTILNKLITFDFLLVNFVDEIKSDILKTFCKFNSMSARVYCLFALDSDASPLGLYRIPDGNTEEKKS